MVLRLADALDVPVPDRNRLLAAAGFAPAYSTHALSDEALRGVRFVIERLLASHAPYPALVLDAWYNVVDANPSAKALLVPEGTSAATAPINLVDQLLGPLHPAIENWPEVVRDTQFRLRREMSARADDTRLAALLAKVDAAAAALPPGSAAHFDSPVLLTVLRTPAGAIRTLSTLVHFGSARDVTVHGLHVELIYPADAQSDAFFRR